jgi:hypothetical protein
VGQIIRLTQFVERLQDIIYGNKTHIEPAICESCGKPLRIEIKWDQITQLNKEMDAIILTCDDCYCSQYIPVPRPKAVKNE